ncbi:hypothetical protein [Thauera aromatica]|uniref:General secretion pathway protein N n=1 Tax=Thauera aromatica K172 TaxID=44139 RepID=A0A2R4BPI3_THAAR|nr:hypothetical protein [Thauera aromatica]AVR89134.1 General secretion pathway protein N [Thauera aromatica K172]
MKRNILPILLGIDAALVVAIAALWAVGDTRWSPPAAQGPEPASLQPGKIEREVMDLASLSETLDRPIFEESRRRPPPQAAAAPASSEPDPLQGVTLLGVFTLGKEQHLMLRAENKVTRLKRGDAFGPWTVLAADERGVTFSQGSEKRQLELVRAPQSEGAPSPLVTLQRQLAGSGKREASSAAEAAAADVPPTTGGKAESAPAAAPGKPATAPGTAAPGKPAVAPGAAAPASRGGSLAERLAARRAARLEADKK